MKKLLAITGALAIFAVSISLAFAGPRRSGGWTSGCGPGGCPVPTQPEAKPLAAAAERWEADDTEAALFRGSVQIGSWSYLHGYWRDYDAKRDAWGPKTLVPPVAPPVRAQAQTKSTRVMPAAEEFEQVEDDWKDVDPNNFGVDWERINEHQATFNGRKIGCDRAIELVGKQVPDDSKKFRVTVIGTPAEQKETLAQFAAIEPEMRDRFNTWAVAADHWSLKDGVTGQVVFKTQGSPVIYVQDPAGKVMQRQDDAKGFPEALRKAVKAYDAAKDPDLRKNEPKKSGEQAGPIHPAIPAFAVLGGLALYFTRKKN